MWIGLINNHHQRNPYQRNHHHASLKSQTGAVLLVLVLILIIGSSYFLATKLNTNLAKTQQYEETGIALSAAKEALIGYAVSYPDKVNPDYGPGYLPCPDLDNDGDAEGSCALAGPTNRTTGRLPFETLELSELRDGSGARLWYALSDRYRNFDGFTPLNSETAGELTINKVGDIVAIIIAPGEPFDNQDRSADANDVTNYLEDDNSDLDVDFITNANVNFNDRLIVITRQELMEVVEKRVLGEVAQALRTYRDDSVWNNKNIYPWLSTFTNPAESSFKGQLAVREGLLGVHRMNQAFDTSFKAKWDIDNGNITTSGSVSVGDLQSDNFSVPDGRCTWLGDPAKADCTNTINYTGICTVAVGPITVPLPNISIDRTYRFQFINDDVQGNELKIQKPKSDKLRRRDIEIKKVPFPDRISQLDISIIDIVSSAAFKGEQCGEGTLTLNSGVTGKIFELKEIEYDLDVPNELPEWFIDNEWHNLIYAAISKWMIPGEGKSCVSRGNCLTLNGNNPSNDNEAIIVIAGAELDSINQDRTGAVTPLVDITDYFELGNNTEDDDVFEYWKNNSDFNDQVKIISD